MESLRIVDHLKVLQEIDLLGKCSLRVEQGCLHRVISAEDGGCSFCRALKQALSDHRIKLASSRWKACH